MPADIWLVVRQRACLALSARSVKRASAPPEAKGVAKKRRILQVTWIDPWGTTDPWLEFEKIREHKPDPHRSTGYEISPKEHNLGADWLVIAGTMNGAGGVGDVVCIPRVLVIKERELVEGSP
jgi:hypothetical protein